MQRLGFIGTGTLTEAVITGLQTSPGVRYSIAVSPRSEAISRALAARYENVCRLGSNQAVLDVSDIVVLAMRPQQIDALDGLYFRREQIVVSFVAGTELAVIAGRVAPASRICRAVPLPPVRFRKGPIAMFPADPLVDALLAPLGDLIVPDREADLAAIAHASALMSSFYAMQNAMADWLRSRGLASDAAALYVGSMFSGLSELALASARSGEPLRPEHHETEGGLNECGRRFLVQAGWFDAIGNALDVVAAHKFDTSEGSGTGDRTGTTVLPIPSAGS